MNRKRLLISPKTILAGLAFAVFLSPNSMAFAESAPAVSAYAELESDALVLLEEAEEEMSGDAVTEVPQEETPAETPSQSTGDTEAAQTEPPQTEASQTEPPQTEVSQTEPPQTEVSQTEPPQTEASQTETSAAETAETTEETAVSESDAGSEEIAEEATEDSEESEELQSELAESETEEQAESEAETEAVPLTDASEVSETIPGFSIDISSYPAADTSANTRYIYNYLIDKLELNHAASCGVLANIQLESGFNQYALGDGGTSYGICQWHEGRFSSLISYCNSAGYDYNTLDGQLAYLSQELHGGYANVLNHLLSVPDTAEGAYDAAYYWCVHFEAPSETYARAAQRGNLAKNEYYPLDLRDVETDAESEAEQSRQTVADIREQMNGEVSESDSEVSFTDLVLGLRQEMMASSANKEEENRQAAADVRRLLSE